MTRVRSDDLLPGAHTATAQHDGFQAVTVSPIFLECGRGNSTRLRSIVPAIFLALLMFICDPLRLEAQLAGIVGIVSDPSGAAIVGASVQATNASTGLAWRVKTREQGDYSFE